MSEDAGEQVATEEAEAAPRKQWNLSWMEVPTERGIRPEIGPEGLTLAAINAGSYGEVPDRWPYRNDTPRGAAPLTNATPSTALMVDEKAELWSENAAVLYEQAIRERWVPALDLPWDALRPLPEPVERAVCQLCTRLSEEGLFAQQVVGRWLEHLSYGYHEVKMYLATQVFDSGRQAEAFRKRALANGGGLGIESPGIANRAVNGIMRFTELVLGLNLLRAATSEALLTALAPAAADSCERSLYHLAARDLQRHIAFGTGHLRFHLEKSDDAPQIHFYLDRLEEAYAVDQARDIALTEALRILAERDRALPLATLRGRQIARYLEALAEGGLPDRRERLQPSLQALAVEH